MGSKNNPGKFDCYGNALPDEPMFILLARDYRAPFLVERWAVDCLKDIECGERPETDRAMAQEAHDCAQAMRDWRTTNFPKWRSPDTLRERER
jgi:hypothetical protein